jgi:hypothetical protein
MNPSHNGVIYTLVLGNYDVSRRAVKHVVRRSRLALLQRTSWPAEQKQQPHFARLLSKQKTSLSSVRHPQYGATPYQMVPL